MGIFDLQGPKQSIKPIDFQRQAVDLLLFQQAARRVRSIRIPNALELFLRHRLRLVLTVNYRGPHENEQCPAGLIIALGSEKSPDDRSVAQTGNLASAGAIVIRNQAAQHNGATILCLNRGFDDATVCDEIGGPFDIGVYEAGHFLRNVQADDPV